MINEIDIFNYRKTEHDIDPLFVKRWSPRAMSGDPISHEELMTLFEAARWAPSSYNEQPWTFLYARKDTESWDLFYDLLVEFNKRWAIKAAALVLILSRKHFSNGKYNPVHVFDAGSAWENMALQGTLKGLVLHGMAGFDYDKARIVLDVPGKYDVVAMFAVGKPGKKEDLPEDIRQKESPSTRKSVSEIVMEGKFKYP